MFYLSDGQNLISIIIPRVDKYMRIQISLGI